MALFGFGRRETRSADVGVTTRVTVGEETPKSELTRSLEEKKEVLERIERLLNDPEFKLQLALDLHSAYCRREKQRRERNNEPIAAWLDAPLFTEQQLDTYRWFDALSPEEKSRIQAISPRTMFNAKNELERDNLMYESDAYQTYQKVHRDRTKALAPLVAFSEYLTELKSLHEMIEFLESILENRGSGEKQRVISKALHATWMTMDWAQERDSSQGRFYSAWENLPGEEKFKDWQQVEALAEILLIELKK